MRIASFVVVAFLTACATTAPPPAPSVVCDRLFFGQTIPGGGTVSAADWQQFVATVITPRFPQGLTIVQGNGQWLDSHGVIEHETMYIVEVEHEKSDAIDAAIAAIAAEYKKRFAQDAVLRITEPVTMRFY